ncbi:DMT family transporter [Pseudogemmobacter sp. W21_MBD1_M6]|uniref:DMT family transporter n=1 Tax=Pseudogemmobacter sp. W21_MBD1_M6 TaxID=3240271 RepID=UPI003F992EBC
MQRKDRLDALGVAGLVGFSLLLGVNQVVIKVVNAGLQPVFFAGLRSLGAILCVWLFMRLRGQRLNLSRDTWGAGMLMGAVFSIEFLFLFLALDLTTVTRTTVIFYSMPVWLAGASHFVLPGERISGQKAVGLACAFAGVSWAIIDQSAGTKDPSLAGDLCALGAAFGWALLVLLSRVTSMSRVSPDMQVFWQVLVSAPILLLAAPLFGPLVRDLQPLHIWLLAFQIVVIVTFGFVFFFVLLAIYPSSSVASFSFLTPVFGVFMGWAVLGEEVGPSIIGALVLVALGIMLINVRLRRPASG